MIEIQTTPCPVTFKEGNLREKLATAITNMSVGNWFSMEVPIRKMQTFRSTVSYLAGRHRLKMSVKHKDGLAYVRRIA